MPRRCRSRTALFDAVVAGLVLNFIPSPERALAEMKRVLRPGGTGAVYVWDHAGEMQLIRHFWDAAIVLDPGARDLDEGRRFPICHPDRLLALFRDAGFERMECRVIDVPTVFENFDDYWSPFLGGQARRRPTAARSTMTGGKGCENSFARLCQSDETGPFG